MAAEISSSRCLGSTASSWSCPRARSAAPGEGVARWEPPLRAPLHCWLRACSDSAPATHRRCRPRPIPSIWSSSKAEPGRGDDHAGRHGHGHASRGRDPARVGRADRRGAPVPGGVRLRGLARPAGCRGARAIGPIVVRARLGRNAVKAATRPTWLALPVLCAALAIARPVQASVWRHRIASTHPCSPTSSSSRSRTSGRRGRSMPRASCSTSRSCRCRCRSRARAFDVVDSTSPECVEEFCLAQLRDLATFALLDTSASTVSFDGSVPAFAAEFDQSFSVQFTFEDMPLGPTLTGGSASIASASRGIAGASSIPGLEGVAIVGQVWLECAVSAPAYLYVFGDVALIGGPLADREIANPQVCPPPARPGAVATSAPSRRCTPVRSLSLRFTNPSSAPSTPANSSSRPASTASMSVRVATRSGATGRQPGQRAERGAAQAGRRRGRGRQEPPRARRHGHVGRRDQ